MDMLFQLPLAIVVIFRVPVSSTPFLTIEISTSLLVPDACLIEAEKLMEPYTASDPEYTSLALGEEIPEKFLDVEITKVGFKGVSDVVVECEYAGVVAS